MLRDFGFGVYIRWNGAGFGWRLAVGGDEIHQNKDLEFLPQSDSSVTSAEGVHAIILDLSCSLRGKGLRVASHIIDDHFRRFGFGCRSSSCSIDLRLADHRRSL